WGFAQVKTIDTIQANPGDPATAEQPEEDGFTTIDTKDLFVFNCGAGVKARAGDNVEIGLSWISPIAVRAKGTIHLDPGDLVTHPSPDLTQVLVPSAPETRLCGDPQGQDSGVCLNIDLPQSLTLGVRYAFREQPGAPEKGDLELDVRW